MDYRVDVESIALELVALLELLLYLIYIIPADRTRQFPHPLVGIVGRPGVEVANAEMFGQFTCLIYLMLIIVKDQKLIGDVTSRPFGCFGKCVQVLDGFMEHIGPTASIIGTGCRGIYRHAHPPACFGHYVDHLMVEKGAVRKYAGVHTGFFTDQ